MTLDKKERLEQKLASLKEMSAQVLKNQDEFDKRDLLAAILETYPDGLWKCVDRGRELFKDNPTRDFFIVTHLKSEWFNPKLWKLQFVPTLECPRPYLNFTVYKYHRKTDEIEMIWCLPDRETLNFYYKNRAYASPEDWDLLKWVLAYKDGSLYKKMQELNGESPDKPFLLVDDISQLKESVIKGES